VDAAAAAVEEEDAAAAEGAGRAVVCDSAVAASYGWAEEKGLEERRYMKAVDSAAAADGAVGEVVRSEDVIERRWAEEGADLWEGEGDRRVGEVEDGEEDKAVSLCP
jgi:hypothetical protein